MAACQLLAFSNAEYYAVPALSITSAPRPVLESSVVLVRSTNSGNEWKALQYQYQYWQELSNFTKASTGSGIHYSFHSGNGKHCAAGNKQGIV